MLDFQIKSFINKHKDWINKQLSTNSKKIEKSDKEILELKKKAKEYIPDRVLKIAEEN
jgi:predicted metal-dependent hydrolase